MTDDIKNSTDDGGGIDGGRRGYLRVVSTDGQPPEPAMVDVPPDSMRGGDYASMLHPGDGPDDADASGARSLEDEEPCPGEQPPAAAHVPQAGGAKTPDAALGDYVLRYSDGSASPAEASKRSFFRRRDKTGSQIGGEQPDDAVAAAAVDVWAAHRGEPLSETDAPGWNQPSEIPSAVPHEAGDGGRRRALVLVVMAAAAVGCLGVIAVAIVGGGGGSAKPLHTSDHRGSTQSAAVTPPTHTITHPATRTTSTVRRHTVRKPPPVKVEETVTTPAVVSTPVTVPTTHTVTHPAPFVSSIPPASTGTSNPTQKPSSTTHSGGSSKNSAGSGTAPAGALPDVQQTEQQP